MSENGASKLSVPWMTDTIRSTGDSTVNKTDKTSTYMKFTFKNDKRMGKGRKG